MITLIKKKPMGGNQLEEIIFHLPLMPPLHILYLMSKVVRSCVKVEKPHKLSEMQGNAPPKKMIIQKINHS
jgi:hypothetical protein